MVTCRRKKDPAVIFVESWFLITVKVITLFYFNLIENVERNQFLFFFF